MTWINTVPYSEATGKLKKLYDRVKGPDDNVDNIMMSHSLRPHSMEAHMAMYKRVLHHTANTIPKEFLEAIGVYVSILNKCNYCVEHHYAGMARLLKDLGHDEDRAIEIRAALEICNPKRAFDDKHAIMLKYTRFLTQTPSELTEHMINKMRKLGITDGEILEVNQVTAYFCYANRTVLGLGVNTDNDIIGLSPGNSDDENDWNHN
ncbi:MAG: peroxidase-related enzyme [Emcibacteraceae bacterium]|nr:peroxidase-related enzyme [Emcibacteraceae bacterium]MDG1858792.1 peroxidase-related enzyme [Emcibacteraceae bacterium]